MQGVQMGGSSSRREPITQARWTLVQVMAWCRQWGQFHKRYLSYQSLKLAWKLRIYFFFFIPPRDKWVKECSTKSCTNILKIFKEMSNTQPDMSPNLTIESSHFAIPLSINHHFTVTQWHFGTFLWVVDFFHKINTCTPALVMWYFVH